MSVGLEHRDIEAWLAAKLEDPWSSEKIASMLTKDIFTHIKAKFTTMDVALKLKLLFSIISLRKKPFKDLEEEILDIFQLATGDEDEWVRILSQILRTLPQDKVVIEDVDAFNRSAERIKTILSKREPQFFPFEYQYLNKELLPATPFTTDNPLDSDVSSTVHFRLKKVNADHNALPQQTPKKSPALRASMDALHTSESITPRSNKFYEPSALKKSYELFEDKEVGVASNNTSASNSADNWGRSLKPPTSAHSQVQAPTRLESSPLSNSRNNLYARNFEGTGSTGLGASGGLGERRGFQKKKRMQIIGIEEVKSITNQQEEMRKRKHGQVVGTEAEGDMSEETEKQRKKREKTEEQEKKKLEREEKRKKKVEDLAQKKQLMEERRAEKEAKKSNAQAVKAIKRSGKPADQVGDGLGESDTVVPVTEVPQAPPQTEPTQVPAQPAIQRKPISFAKPNETSPAISPNMTMGIPAYPAGVSVYQSHAQSTSLFSGITTNPSNSAADTNVVPSASTPKDSLSSLLSQALLPQPTQYTTTATPYTPAVQPIQYTPTIYTPAVAVITPYPPTSMPYPPLPVTQSVVPPSTQTPVAQPSFSVSFARPAQVQPPVVPVTTLASTLLSTTPLVAAPLPTTPTTAPSTMPPIIPVAPSFPSIPPTGTDAAEFSTATTPLSGILPSHSAITNSTKLCRARRAISPEQQQQTQALLSSLFEQANQLSPEHKEIIVQFLSGNRTNPNPNEGSVKQIQLNLEQKINPENNIPFIEMIIFEINYTSGSWRKFRRKRNINARPNN